MNDWKFQTLEKKNQRILQKGLKTIWEIKNTNLELTID